MIRSAFAALLLALLLAFPVRAHDGLPVTVNVEESDVGRFSLTLVIPPAVPQSMSPQARLTAPCVAARGSYFACPRDFSGASAELDWPNGAPAVPILVRVTWRDGQQATALGTAGQSIVLIPARETASGVSAAYFLLGLDHILGGWDHLAFLACLALIASSARRILFAVTGFTLGHALSISAAALGLAGLPPAPVEAAIALSVMFLAAEALRGRQDTLMFRFPVLVSMLFGLLHGFGFASALRDIGLPQTQLPMALLAFNLGIEVGQLLLVAVGLLMSILMRKYRSGWADPGRTWLCWGAGSVGAFWLLQRLPAVFNLL